MQDLDILKDLIKSYNPDEFDRVMEAYQFAENAHKNQ